MRLHNLGEPVETHSENYSCSSILPDDAHLRFSRLEHIHQQLKLFFLVFIRRFMLVIRINLHLLLSSNVIIDAANSAWRANVVTETVTDYRLTLNPELAVVVRSGWQLAAGEIALPIVMALVAFPSGPGVPLTISPRTWRTPFATVVVPE